MFSVSLLFIFIVFATDVSAQQISLTAAGVVRDITTGQPIGGATVIATPSTDTHRSSRGATTDSFGRFSFSNLTRDLFRFNAQKRGFISVVSANNSKSIVTVRLETDQLKLEIFLQKPGVITGTVRGPDGQPFPFASVEVLREDIVHERLELVKVNQTISNDIGEYRFWNLPSATYYVRAHSRDDAGVLGLHQRIMGDGITRSEDFAVVYYPSVTSFAEASPITVSSGMSADHIDIQLAFVLSSEIRGQLEFPPSSGAIHSAVVTLRPMGKMMGPRQQFLVDARSSSFIFRSISPGIYELKAQASSPGTAMSAFEIIEVTEAIPLREVTLTMTTPTAVEGRLIISPSAQSIPGLVLRIEGLDDPIKGSFPVSGEGLFRLPEMPFGRYRIQPVVAPDSLYLESVRVDGMEMPSGNWILANAIKQIEVIARLDGGTLTVTSADRNDSSELLRTAILVGSDHDGFYIRSNRLDQSGTSRLVPVPPGTYRVGLVEHATSKAQLDSGTVRQVWKTGASVEVLPSSKSSIVARVIRVLP